MHNALAAVCTNHLLGLRVWRKITKLADRLDANRTLLETDAKTLEDEKSSVKQGYV